MTQKQLEILRGRKSTDEGKVSWDKKFSSENYIFGKDPADSLTKYIEFLPKKRLKVLDLAMSEGRNTVFMAKKGHEVTGIDISSVAIKKANALARENKVKFKGIVSDLTKYEFKENEFDVILCYYFLNRNLITRMKNGLDQVDTYCLKTLPSVILLSLKKTKIIYSKKMS